MTEKSDEEKADARNRDLFLAITILERRHNELGAAIDKMTEDDPAHRYLVETSFAIGVALAEMYPDELEAVA